MPKFAPYYDRDGITLYHGDSREVLRHLDDAPIDVVFTDPPYGHNNNNGDLIHNRERALGKTRTAAKARPIANDGPEATEILEGVPEQLARVLRSSSSSSIICCCGGGGPDPQFARWSLLIDKYLSFKQMVVWDKGKMGLGWHYRRSYEVCLVATKGKQGCNWYDESKKVENIIRPGDYGIKKIIPKKTDHPTPKPVALVEHFLRLHSTGNDLVLDPFNGGESTAIAARNLGRRMIGIDVDRHWLDHTIERLESCPA